MLVHSKKLVGSRHLLLKTATSLLYDGAGGFEAVGTVGWIVLLMSQCRKGVMSVGTSLGQQSVSGIRQVSRSC
jgi:hypothetical protein